MPDYFPPVDKATEDGLLAVGGDLDIETLTEAYLHGIFPWPVEENYPLTWFSPNPRGVILKEDIHFPKSFLKALKKMTFSYKFNSDFSEVITQCAQAKRKNELGTWIIDDISSGYTSLFNAGKAYCISVYNEDSELIGGLYGVCFGKLISGESMFYKESGASKFALYQLLNTVKKSDIPFIDTQMVTPTIELFGGKNIEREDFIEMIKSLDTDIPRDQLFSCT